MPARLRPTAPVAPDALLVGDPGRALLLAQELLEQPRMCNHARGLWGYSGARPGGGELTIQATGMGGPSAAAVLADLAELGVRRAVRVGTCAGLDAAARPGELLLVSAAVAGGGSAASFGVEVGGVAEPDPELTARLREALPGEARAARATSFDAMPPPPTAFRRSFPPYGEGKEQRDNESAEERPGVAAADMQTVALLAAARELGIAAAAILIVAEGAVAGALPETLGDEELAEAAKRAGRAASQALSNPQVEG